jgi:ribosome biogenesis ATPase
MFCVSSTELVAGVSGESERKIRMLFAEAELAAPALILIDDIDVIAAKRENAQRELERRIVTQLIASLDGNRVWE